MREETLHRSSSTLISCRMPSRCPPSCAWACQNRWLSGDETTDSHMAPLNHLTTRMHLHVLRFGERRRGHEWWRTSLSCSGMDKWRMAHLICPHQANPTVWATRRGWYSSTEGSPLLHPCDPGTVEVSTVVQSECKSEPVRDRQTCLRHLDDAKVLDALILIKLRSLLWADRSSETNHPMVRLV